MSHANFDKCDTVWRPREAPKSDLGVITGGLSGFDGNEKKGGTLGRCGSLRRVLNLVVWKSVRELQMPVSCKMDDKWAGNLGKVLEMNKGSLDHNCNTCT